MWRWGMGRYLIICLLTQVWPKDGRYVSMSDETVSQIARRYSLQPREIVELNAQRVEGLRAGAVLYEGTVLQFPGRRDRCACRAVGVGAKGLITCALLLEILPRVHA